MATNMILAGTTLTQNPSAATIPQKKRSAFGVETVGGVEFFSWGTFIEGTEIVLRWDNLITSEYATLASLFVADAATTFYAASGLTGYNVQITNLTADYFISAGDDAPHRRNVVLTMLVLSEI